MSLWLIGFVAGLVIVLVVALLLIGILVEAMRIRALARRASDLVLEIDHNTRGVWALRDTHAIAESLVARQSDNGTWLNTSLDLERVDQTAETAVCLFELASI